MKFYFGLLALTITALVGAVDLNDIPEGQLEKLERMGQKTMKRASKIHANRVKISGDKKDHSNANSNTVTKK